MTQAKLTKTHRWDPKLYASVEQLANQTGRPVQHVLDALIAAALGPSEMANYGSRSLVRAFADLVYREQMVSNQAAWADKGSHKVAGEWLKARELDTKAVKEWPEVKHILTNRDKTEVAASHDWGGNRDDFYALAGNRVLVINAYGEVYGWQLRQNDEVPEILDYEEHMEPDDAE